ncbi:MAG: 2-dehydro-3-deoxygalactonokinase [Spirosomataceae bacterium]
MKSMNKFIIGCDWGTSSFRLRLINIQSQEAISEVVTPSGVAFIFNEWENTLPYTNRLTFFKNYLQTQLQKLSFQSDVALEGLSIVISGMASSSIGMIDLHYADLPFDLSGQEIVVSYVAQSDTFPHETWIVSGIKSDNDVMRGEETQLIGIAQLFPFSSHKKYVVLLPGTHSKHIFVEGNTLKHFQTYMTGELFSIVSSYSVLKDSIDKTSLHHPSPQDMAAFTLGVEAVASTDILQLLFRVRTHQLFQKMTKTENAHYLSGIFIGGELKHLITINVDELIIGCGRHLYPFYKTAIEALQITHKTTLIDPEKVDRATIMGQIKIFQNQALTVGLL